MLNVESLNSAGSLGNIFEGIGNFFGGIGDTVSDWWDDYGGVVKDVGSFMGSSVAGVPGILGFLMNKAAKQGVKKAVDFVDDGLSSVVTGDTSSDLVNALQKYWQSSAEAVSEQAKLNEQAAVNAYNRSREYRQTYLDDIIPQMKKYGINPILAYQSLSGAGGSSMPASASSAASGETLSTLLTAIAELKKAKSATLNSAASLIAKVAPLL